MPLFLAYPGAYLLLEHDPSVEPEGMLFRKPVSTPDQVGGRLFGIML